MPNKIMLSIQATPDVASIRTAELYNEEHTIIPCVALVEGVLWPANAPAPELALAEEFGRFPDGWNGRPVVFDHPKVNGEAVSASHPDVLEDVGFGQLFNTVVTNDGKLKTEIWINEERVKNMSEDVQDTVDRLKGGDETVEVSTGLFTMSEVASGEFEGEAFEMIWRNIVPDHLAILPVGVKGACSVADGCGAPRTNHMKPVMRAMQMNINASNCECDDDTKGIFQKIMEKAGDILGITGSSENLSDNDTRTAIQGALSTQEQYFWIMAVFDGGDGTGIVVYESFDTGKLFERAFTIDEGGGVTIGADKKEVRPVTQFVEVPNPADVTDNAVNEDETETQDGSIQEISTMKEKDQLVSDLIASEATQFADSDRDWLSTLEESQLASMSPIEIEAPTEEVKEPSEEPSEEANAEEIVDNNEGPVSTEDYIAAAPVEVQEVLNESLRMHSGRKDALVKGILDNARCSFSDKDLQAKSLTELEQIASLASDITFEGQAPVVSREHEDDNLPPEPVQLFDLSKTA